MSFKRKLRNVAAVARFVRDNRQQLALNVLKTAQEGVMFVARKTQKLGIKAANGALSLGACAVDKLVLRGLWKPKETGTPPRRENDVSAYDAADATDDMGRPGYANKQTGDWDQNWGDWQRVTTDQRGADGILQEPPPPDPSRQPVILPPPLKGKPHLHAVAEPHAPSVPRDFEDDYDSLK